MPDYPLPQFLSDDLHTHTRLRMLRDKHGHTQKEIAHVLNVSFQQIQKYETGKNRLPVEKLYALKHFYDVPFEMFFDSDEVPKTRYESDFIIDHIYARLKHMKNGARRQHLCRIIDLLLREKEAVA